jgi:hypothetical protein
MKAYWWAVQPNFGDQLTPFFADRLLGTPVTWAPPEDAEIVLVGSVLDVLPPDWSGIIAGAGQLHERTTVPPLADVRALRGALSARSYGGDVVLGDPALLMDELVPEEEKQYNLGLIPHWTDRNTATLAKRFAHLDPHVIDPAQDPATVAREISRSKKIVSSSLHGIIIADAYGIPRRAETFPKMSSHHEGGTFKFEDYATVTGVPMEFGKLQEPDRQSIERAQVELFDMFEHLKGEIDASRANQHPGPLPSGQRLPRGRLGLAARLLGARASRR